MKTPGVLAWQLLVTVVRFLVLFEVPENSSSKTNMLRAESVLGMIQPATAYKGWNYTPYQVIQLTPQHLVSQQPESSQPQLPAHLKPSDFERNPFPSTQAIHEPKQKLSTLSSCRKKSAASYLFVS